MLHFNPMRKHVIFYITSVLILSSLISTLNTYKCSQRRADSNPDATFRGFGIFHYHAIASSIFEQFLCFHSYSHCLLFHRPSPYFHVLASISCKTDSPSDDFFGLTRTIKGRKSSSLVFYWIVFIWVAKFCPKYGCTALPVNYVLQYSDPFALPKKMNIFMPAEWSRRWFFLHFSEAVQQLWICSKCRDDTYTKAMAGPWWVILNNHGAFSGMSRIIWLDNFSNTYV